MPDEQLDIAALQNQLARTEERAQKLRRAIRAQQQQNADGVVVVIPAEDSGWQPVDGTRFEITNLSTDPPDTVRIRPKQE